MRRPPLRVKPLTANMIAKYEAEYRFSKAMLAWANRCQATDDAQEIKRRLELIRNTNRAICTEANFCFTLRPVKYVKR
jgi:hypothetical protein